jgi:hypothetical protein
VTDPIVESRIREIKAGRAKRDADRAEKVMKQRSREQKSQELYDQEQSERRQSLSPNELTAAQRHTELVNYYASLYENKQEQERQGRVRAALKTMRSLKDEYLVTSSLKRRAEIVKQYLPLCREIDPKSTTTIDDVFELLEKARKDQFFSRLQAAAAGTKEIGKEE